MSKETYNFVYPHYFTEVKNSIIIQTNFIEYVIVTIDKLVLFYSLQPFFIHAWCFAVLCWHFS